MKVLVASDKFKGSMTAAEACHAIAKGLGDGCEAGQHKFECIPIADGGDGLARTLTEAKSGDWVEVNVKGPLGDAITAGYGLIDAGKTAVIEMAGASGIALLSDKTLDPWRASTFGTGELIRDAMARGVDEIILGIGGSATNDGGMGMAQALGFRFFHPNGNEIPEVPAGVETLGKVLPPESWKSPRVTVACDVDNPLAGPNGCTRIYGPQKGIAEDDFPKHERRLSQLVEASGEAGKKHAMTKGSGAAGGLGFGCLFFLDAELVAGFDLVADHLDLERHVAAADLVITGEGKIDHQSLSGKGPAGVAQMALRLGKQRAAFCGMLDDPDEDRLFGQIYEIRDPELSVEENMARGVTLLRGSAEEAAPRLLS